MAKLAHIETNRERKHRRRHSLMQGGSPCALLLLVVANRLGVRPLAPGYAKMMVRPAAFAHAALTRASGNVTTPHGVVVVAWATTAATAANGPLSPAGPRLELTVTVPAGADAVVVMPAGAMARPLLEEGAVS